MTANRLTQSKARMNESEKNGVCISANVMQSTAGPSQLRLAMATMGPVLASAFCVAAIMYPLGDRWIFVYHDVNGYHTYQVLRECLHTSLISVFFFCNPLPLHSFLDLIRGLQMAAASDGLKATTGIALISVNLIYLPFHPQYYPLPNLIWSIIIVCFIFHSNSAAAWCSIPINIFTRHILSFLSPYSQVIPGHYLMYSHLHQYVSSQSAICFSCLSSF